MSNETKRPRFNIVDVLALIAVIALVVFVVYKTQIVNPKIAPAPTPYKMTLLIEEVRQETVDVVKVGLDARAFDANVYLGKISAVDVQPALTQVPTADGRLVESQVPNRYDLRITFDTQAIVTDTAVRIANTDLRIGQVFTVVGQRYLVKGTIVGLEERK